MMVDGISEKEKKERAAVSQNWFQQTMPPLSAISFIVTSFIVARVWWVFILTLGAAPRGFFIFHPHLTSGAW